MPASSSSAYASCTRKVPKILTVAAVYDRRYRRGRLLGQQFFGFEECREFIRLSAKIAHVMHAGVLPGQTMNDLKAPNFHNTEQHTPDIGQRFCPDFAIATLRHRLGFQ